MARITLKNIETLTYNFTETEMEQAKALSADLDELYSKYHALLRHTTASKCKCSNLVHA